MPPTEEVRALRLSAGGELADGLEAFIKPELRGQLGESALYLYGSKLVHLPPIEQQWPDEPIYEELVEQHKGGGRHATWFSFNQYQHLLTSINNQEFGLWPNFKYEYTEHALKLHFILNPKPEQEAKMVRQPFYNKTLDPESRTISLHRRIPMSVMVGAAAVSKTLERIGSLMGVDDESLGESVPRNRAVALRPILVNPYRPLSILRLTPEISNSSHEVS